MHGLLTWLDPREKGRGMTWRHWIGVHVIAATVALSGVLSGVFAVHHLVGRGGYNPAPDRSIPRFTPGPGKQPPLVTVKMGGALPGSFSLAADVVRIHNQGTSFGCVGHTFAEIIEIENAERYARLHGTTRGAPAMSSGFVWNLINGGVNGVSSYTDALRVVQNEGEATLAAFPPDGQSWDYGVWPSQAVIASAAPRRVGRYVGIWSWDRATIEGEIASGIPLAFAMPWYSSLDSMQGYSYRPVVTGQWGSFLWWHSTVLIGYDANGVTLLSSFGPGWGYHGTITLSWSYLASLPAGGYSIMAVNMLSPMPPPYHPPKPITPHLALAVQHEWDRYVARWNAAHPHKHQALISPAYRGHLSMTATFYEHARWRTAGGITGKEQWLSKQRVMKAKFQGFTLYYWPSHPRWKPAWTWHRWIKP